ncbi:MAG TPA: DinB family protein [Oryzihumus sp.]|nr:DinB family protein [Oryzihumus sp.]
MTWTAPEVTLPDGPLTGEDRPMLEGFLAWHRALLQHKCAGLTGEQLAQRSVPPSNLSLLGLVRHMAKVERKWFRELIAGQELEPMYDPALGKDADFEDLDPAKAQADYERLLEECRLAGEVLAAASYEQTIESRMGVMSVRAVVVHMIEEYAQHSGHADLLRECVDGTTDK